MAPKHRHQRFYYPSQPTLHISHRIDLLYISKYKNNATRMAQFFLDRLGYLSEYNIDKTGDFGDFGDK